MESMVDIKVLEKEFKNKKIFITGHSGFKGAWFTYLLDYVGAVTHGYSLSPNTKPSLYSSLTFSNRHTFIYSDINDYKKLKNEVKIFKPDFIFHFAAQPLVIESYKNPQNTFQTNFSGTLNLLETIKTLEKECVSIFITTDKVYENQENNKPFKESDPLGGIDPYSASKAASEILIHSYYNSFFKNNNIKVGTVRAGNVIGGGDWSKDRLIPDIIKSAMESKKLLIRNPGSTRPWQHVLDPLSGYLNLAIRLSKSPNKFYGSWNFGPEVNKNITVKQIIELSINEGLDIRFSYNKCGEYESNFLSLSIEKSKNYLKWIPKWDCEFSVKRTINWYLKYYQGKNTNDLLMDDIKTFYN